MNKLFLFSYFISVILLNAKTNSFSSWLELFQVDRKLVKQTVMTSVYGVTYVGARDQIKRRLMERNAIADDDELFAASCYVAKVINLTL